MIANEKAAKFWDAEWLKRTDGDELIFNEEKRRKITDYLKVFGLNGETILDVGCGIGQFNMKFLWKNWTGIDLSEAAINYGKKNRPASNYIHGDVLDLSEDQKFDVIMAWDSLEHMDLTMELANKIDQLSHKKSIFMGNVPTAFFTEAGEFEHEMSYEILHKFLINCGYLMINTSTHYTKGVQTLKYKDGRHEEKKYLYPFLLFRIPDPHIHFYVTSKIRVDRPGNFFCSGVFHLIFGLA